MLERLIVWSLAAAVTYLVAIAAIGVTRALRAGGRREDPVGDRDAVSASRFTIPVSLIVPLNATTAAAQPDVTIAALLELNYPELEVLVVAEGLPDEVWRQLQDTWRLEAREFFYRASIATAPIRMMYRSARDPRMLVVQKMPGTMADALNCGVNLARFRYVGAVEPGLVFDGDALLRAMTAPLRDPAGVVGATIHVEIAGAIFQRLRSIRSLMESRVVWRNTRAALGPRDAVVVWRRDALEQSGGFSSAAADPQLEMMIRLQTFTAAGVPGQVVRSSEIFGCRAPRGFAEQARVTTRRQLAALQAMSSLRKAGPHTHQMLMLFLVSEVITPCVQAWVIAASAVSALAGWLPRMDVALALLLVTIGQGSVSTAAVLLRGAISHGDDALDVRLLLLAPFDFLVVGAATAYARSAGAWAFLRSRAA